MILFKDEKDVAMRYEGLARAAFNNCIKYGDPWGYAAQDRYADFVPTPTLTGRRALSTILIKLIIDNTQSPYLEGLRLLEEKVWSTETQEDIIDIINKAIEIVVLIQG